jgi:sulfatase modifying factor 1
MSLAGGAVAQITIETVTVGNVGNAADTTGYGAMAYSYNIGKYEVTNTQYAAFLNAKAATDTYSLYNTSMGSAVYGGITRAGSSGSFTYAVKGGYENKPVTYVNFWDATRFANWLNNGQGGADTETGSYTLTSEGISANTVTRNGGANWVVPSENEWYKAAFYDPTKNSNAGGYWLHATRSDTLGENNPFTASNGANYHDGDYAVYTGSNDGALPVGSYANAVNYYGTFDQGGNLWEWNEAIVNGSSRGVSGGSWPSVESNMLSSNRSITDATTDYFTFGIRVASLGSSVPEPSTCAALCGFAALVFAAYRRRNR